MRPQRGPPVVFRFYPAAQPVSGGEGGVHFREIPHGLQQVLHFVINLSSSSFSDFFRDIPDSSVPIPTRSSLPNIVRFCQGREPLLLTKESLYTLLPTRS